MKKILITIALLFVVGIGFCTTIQYSGIGAVQMSSASVNGPFGLWNLTKAQIAALAAVTTGQFTYCSDCTSAGNAGTICVSTGGYIGNVLIGQFVLSTGTVCK